MRSNRTTNQSLLISLIIHGVILLVLGVYITYTQSPVIQEFVASTFLQPQKEVKPPDRPNEVRPVMRPTITTNPPVIMEEIPLMPRVATAAVVRPSTRANTTTVLKFSNVPVQHDVRVDLSMPKVEVMPDIVTYAKIPATTSSEAIAISPPVGTSAAPRAGRGIVDKQIRVAKAPAKAEGLTMIKILVVAEAGLTDVVEAVRIGAVEVPPLPRGEPGGSVVGRGKDIRGVFRLVRVQHDLSDWWADQSALVALTEWLNTQTKIKTDMNVEGGAVRLTDAKMSKAPLVFFTGHDPAQAKSHGMTRDTAFRNRLTEQERDGLRKYLIDDGGFVYFDDCGVNAPAEAFVRLTLAQLRYAMPEYTVDRIPNDHLIYNNYYDMGGPPVGFDIFWWGTHPPKRNFLEGITIGDHLAVVVCRRDYMCSMESVSLPTRTVHYSPGVYRFSTNVVVYSLTHGGVSDYSKYVPDDDITTRISIDAPTLVPTLE